MLHLNIPGWGQFALEVLVLDYNGTLALDGGLLPEVAPRLKALARHLRICVLTADTYGTVQSACSGLPVEVVVTAPEDVTGEKERFVAGLGPERVVAIGNGYNDQRMLKAAALGIAVLGPEGAYPATLQAADVVAPDIGAALDLLLYPDRLKATLRT